MSIYWIFNNVLTSLIQCPCLWNAHGYQTDFIDRAWSLKLERLNLEPRSAWVWMMLEHHTQENMPRDVKIPSNPWLGRKDSYDIGNNWGCSLPIYVQDDITTAATQPENLVRSSTLPFPGHEHYINIYYSVTFTSQANQESLTPPWKTFFFCRDGHFGFLLCVAALNQLNGAWPSQGGLRKFRVHVVRLILPR